MQQAPLTQSCLPQTRPGSAFPSRAKREQLEKLIFLSQRLKTPPANFEGTKPAMIRKSEGLNNSVPISYLGLFRYGGCCRAVCESPKQQVVSLCAYAILASKNGVRVFPHRLYLLVRYKDGVPLSLFLAGCYTNTIRFVRALCSRSVSRHCATPINRASARRIRRGDVYPARPRLVVNTRASKP